MRRAAAAIRARAEDLLPLVIAETGATAAVGSRLQVPIAADRFERYGRELDAVVARSLPPQVAEATPLAPGGLISALALRQPVGVVTCITSYNFPLVNMAGKVAPALAMGNTVVVKPAAQDPLGDRGTGARSWKEVGFPPGVVNLVNAADAGPAGALVESADVDMVSFTGSTAGGHAYHPGRGAHDEAPAPRARGQRGVRRPQGLPSIEAAVGCVGSTWSFHSGQICTAPTRAVVHRSVFDQFVEKLRAYAGALKVGDPTELDTIVGPLISASRSASASRHFIAVGPATRAPSSFTAEDAPPISPGASTWSPPCSWPTTP